MRRIKNTQTRMLSCVSFLCLCLGANAAFAPTRRRFVESVRKSHKSSFHSRGNFDISASPVVSATSPDAVAISGGAVMTIRGVNFERNSRCKFFATPGGRASEAEATRVTSTELTCVLPDMRDAGNVHDEVYIQVFARNSEYHAWSGIEGNFQWSRTNSFGVVQADASAPGCYGCYSTSAPAIASRARESWTIAKGENTGPEDGGTTILIKSTVASGSGARTGTFYQGSSLKCGAFCSTSSPSGWVKSLTAAKWIANDEIECVTPPWPGNGVTSSTVSRACLIRVTNDGATFDDLISSGGDGDGTQTLLTNAAKVDFTYVASGTAPSVTSVASSRMPATSSRSARGPFAGGAVVVVRGSNFLSSVHLGCKFTGGSSGFPDVVVPATYVSSTEVHCVSPRRDVSDDDVWKVDYVSDAPCFDAAVHVSNQKSRSNEWSTSSGTFHYCDLYVSSSGSRDGDGTPLRPFSTISDAALNSLVDPIDPQGRFVLTDEHGFGAATTRSMWLNTDVVRLETGMYSSKILFASSDDDAATRKLTVRGGDAVIDCEGDDAPNLEIAGFYVDVQFINCGKRGEALVERCDIVRNNDGGDAGASCAFSRV